MVFREFDIGKQVKDLVDFHQDFGDRVTEANGENSVRVIERTELEERVRQLLVGAAEPQVTPKYRIDWDPTGSEQITSYREALARVPADCLDSSKWTVIADQIKDLVKVAVAPMWRFMVADNEDDREAAEADSRESDGIVFGHISQDNVFRTNMLRYVTDNLYVLEAMLGLEENIDAGLRPKLASIATEMREYLGNILYYPEFAYKKLPFEKKKAIVRCYRESALLFLRLVAGIVEPESPVVTTHLKMLQEIMVPIESEHFAGTLADLRNSLDTESVSAFDIRDPGDLKAAVGIVNKRNLGLLTIDLGLGLPLLKQSIDTEQAKNIHDLVFQIEADSQKILYDLFILEIESLGIPELTALTGPEKQAIVALLKSIPFKVTLNKTIENMREVLDDGKDEVNFKPSEYHAAVYKVAHIFEKRCRRFRWFTSTASKAKARQILGSMKTVAGIKLLNSIMDNQSKSAQIIKNNLPTYDAE